MASVQQFVKLSSGRSMPIIGFGTWKLRNDVENVITNAIKTGYRHIDTAYMYRNESEIGNALYKLFQEGIVKRQDLYIVTKLPSHAHHRDKIPEVLAGCLERLKLNYVDLFLIHSPMFMPEMDPEKGVSLTDKDCNLVDTWKGMEDVYRQGLTKAIGLSNFNSIQIKRILDSCSVKPENLQVECHAYFQQRNLYRFCQDNDITFTAYSPIGRPDLINQNGEQLPVLLKDKQVREVAENHGKTPAQVLLRFLIQLGIVVIPKSANPERMKENIEVFDFNLSEEDMDILKNLDRGLRYVLFNSPPGQTDHPEYPFKAAF